MCALWCPSIIDGTSESLSGAPESLSLNVGIRSQTGPELLQALGRYPAPFDSNGYLGYAYTVLALEIEGESDSVFPSSHFDRRVGMSGSP